MIVQYGYLRIIGVWFCYIGFVLLFIANQPVFKPCFGYFGSSLYDCPVGLLDLLMTLEHFVQTRKGFGCTGKENYPARRPIQTMGHTEKDFAGLVVFLLDIRLNGLAQRRVTGLIALHDFVASLVNRYNMIVFV